jgi:pyruvate/2-oxoglutarate dehydrogenase complex dihydrolipoamide acyltransferase (E2) component
MIVEVIGLFFQNTMHFVNDACSVWQRQVFEMEGCWKWNVRRCDPDEIRVGAGATAKVGEVVAVIDGDMTAKASVLNAAPAAKTSQWRPPFEEVSTPRFVVNRAPELELAGPRSSRPSHRDANARLAAGVDAEVFGRTTARTSIPIVAPFRRRYPDRAPQQIFDIAIAERETHKQPNGVPDDRKGGPKACVRKWRA